jgi:hypothetical protein
VTVKKVNQDAIIAEDGEIQDLEAGMLESKLYLPDVDIVELDQSQTLKECLQGALVFEYPTITISL